MNTCLRFHRRQVDLFGAQIKLLHRNVLLDLVGLVVQLALDAAQLGSDERLDGFLWDGTRGAMNEKALFYTQMLRSFRRDNFSPAVA